MKNRHLGPAKMHGNSASLPSLCPLPVCPRESSMRSRSQEFHRKNGAGLNSHNGRKQNRDPYETKSPVRSKLEGQSKPMRSAHSEYNRSKTTAKSTWDREAPQSKPTPQLGPSKSEAYQMGIFLLFLSLIHLILSFPRSCSLWHFIGLHFHHDDISMTTLAFSNFLRPRLRKRSVTPPMQSPKVPLASCWPTPSVARVGRVGRWSHRTVEAKNRYSNMPNQRTLRRWPRNFRTKVLDISCQKVVLKIWQLFALQSVLMHLFHMQSCWQHCCSKQP